MTDKTTKPGFLPGEVKWTIAPLDADYIMVTIEGETSHAMFPFKSKQAKRMRRQLDQAIGLVTNQEDDVDAARAYLKAAREAIDRDFKDATGGWDSRVRNVRALIRKAEDLFSNLPEVKPVAPELDLEGGGNGNPS